MSSLDGNEHQEDQISSAPLLEKTQKCDPAPYLRKRYVLLPIVSIVLIAFESVNRDGVCRQPSVRREWRTLSRAGRIEYLRAVKYLSSIRSTGCNGTVHDEFAYTHRNIGGFRIEAASFLRWHRYFLHTFEKTLKYWDWTLDSANLTQAPVWSTTDGFGGNGNRHCVQDGPFAGIQVQYFEEAWEPHCLSRSLLPHQYLGFCGLRVTIPLFVRGYFLHRTAPNEPFFFLHHGQLDRLWRKWQSTNLNERGMDYNDPSRQSLSVTASLTDQIEIAGLAAYVPVRSLMIVNRGELCYEYSN
ncbi:putative tyrosinase [Xylariaceae sp. FL0255]|nr:putative tyrosinase [Xylariaceae sp. FL0255]